jgi:hypothetical protein
MFRSLVIMFAGLAIPALMDFGWLPSNLLLCFTGLGLASIGAVVTLINCGEI